MVLSMWVVLAFSVVNLPGAVFYNLDVSLCLVFVDGAEDVIMKSVQ